MKYKQPLLCLALTCLTACITLCFCLFLGRASNYLPNHAAIPADITEKAYIITDVHPDPERQILTVHLTHAPQNTKLALMINDMGSFVLHLQARLNGSPLYSYQPDSPFSRIHVVELPASLLQTGELFLTIDSSDWQNRSQEVLSSRQNAAPSILVSSLDHAQQVAQQADLSMNLLIGMYLVIILLSLTMFASRPREFGYLFLAALCAVRLVNTSIDASLFPGLTIGIYYQLRHILVVLPVVCYAAVGIWLLRPAACHHNLRYLLCSAFLTLFATVLQDMTPYNWYHLFQWIAFLSFFFCCLRAAARRQLGWPLLCVGYTAGYAMVAFLYLVNIWNVLPPSTPLICTNFTNFTYLPGILASMIYISRQLVHTFNETEKLSGQLLCANQELDRRVEEKTARLTALLESRQNMMLNIFHDLRNPVFVLKGCLDTLSGQDDRQKACIQTMRTRLNLLETLINDLFLLEKLEAGVIVLYPDNVELDALLREIANGLSAAGDKTIHTDLSPVVVWGDATRLFQAFQNLAENAQHYTPAGGSISFSLHSEGDQAQVVIADTGIGISQEECSHLFDRYYTGSRSKKYQSSGLGLNIAAQLIHLHGGTIQVKSQPHAGTTVTVTLPLIPDLPKDSL